MGLFIVFEGVEGSGKSTQSKALVERLQAEGHRPKPIREPGGTPIGEQVRSLLQSDIDIPSLSELFLFNAARSALVEQVLHPALDGGEIVVCDRFTYSTVAYQRYGRGLNASTVDSLNRMATGGLEADLIVLMDLAPEAGFVRKSGDNLDRIERENAAFFDRVRQGYLAQAQDDSDRWLVLDASQSPESLAEAIWERVSRLVESKPEKT